MWELVNAYDIRSRYKTKHQELINMTKMSNVTSKLKVGNAN